MNYVKLNNDKTYNLLWYNFRRDARIQLENTNIAELMESFSNIKKLDIYDDNDNLVASYTGYDSYENISITNHNSAIEITLKAKDIEKKISDIENYLYPSIDMQTASIDECKEYMIRKIGEECRQDIYAGSDVVFSDGTTEHFSFNADDQSDLKSLFDIAIQNPSISLSYHSDGNVCRFYTGEQIIEIYATLQMKLLRCTTVCNAINQLIRNARIKKDVMECKYNMELPESLQTNVDNIINGMKIVFEGVKRV